MSKKVSIFLTGDHGWGKSFYLIINASYNWTWPICSFEVLLSEGHCHIVFEYGCSFSTFKERFILMGTWSDVCTNPSDSQTTRLEKFVITVSSEEPLNALEKTHGFGTLQVSSSLSKTHWIRYGFRSTAINKLQQLHEVTSSSMLLIK